MVQQLVSPISAVAGCRPAVGTGKEVVEVDQGGLSLDRIGLIELYFYGVELD